MKKLKRLVINEVVGMTNFSDQDIVDLENNGVIIGGFCIIALEL